MINLTRIFLILKLLQNSVPIAPKQASELKAIMSQFPVSSGKQHSLVENAWVPVTTSNGSSSTTTTTTTSKSVVTLSKQIQEQLPELAKPKSKPKPAVELPPPLTKPYDWKSDDHYCKSIVPASEIPPPPSEPPVDVSEIISQRLNAMRKLQENPNDVEASKTLYETQQNVRVTKFIYLIYKSTYLSDVSMGRIKIYARSISWKYGSSSSFSEGTFKWKTSVGAS